MGVVKHWSKMAVNENNISGTNTTENAADFSRKKCDISVRKVPTVCNNAGMKANKSKAKTDNEMIL